MTHPSRPLGDPVPDWTPPPTPPRTHLSGLYCQLEPLSEVHLPELYAAFSEDGPGAMWDYLPAGPYESYEAFAKFADGAISSEDPMFFAIRADDNRALGFATYMRIQPGAGSIEVGFITMSPALQRTRSATEAIILMARQAFDLGYRRFEWKCNALNAASRRAAIRYGFSYEGIFRQAAVVKGRNRDTAWFAMIDAERGALDDAWSAWLDPSNFDAAGRQRCSLADLTRPHLACLDPTH